MRLFLALLAPLSLTALTSARFVMYADEWHPTRPTNKADRNGIDHVILAFAQANNTAAYTPKVPISVWRSEFEGAKIMIAIGGWGDPGFSSMVATDDAINMFAKSVNTMLQTTGADGVDIDWEYPGGNGADYKQAPNTGKAGEILAYPKLLQAVRKAIGTNKLLSTAVPAKKEDMIAYTRETGPQIWPSVDFVNVMSYDIMNRRAVKTAHHTSVVDSNQTIQNYLDIGAPPSKLNLGFAMYAKWFTTDGDCTNSPLGCKIKPAEAPQTGDDLKTSGAYTFEKGHMSAVDTSKVTPSFDGTCGGATMKSCSSGCCSQDGYCGTSTAHCGGGCLHAFTPNNACTGPDVAGSWINALKDGTEDKVAGGQYYYDKANGLFWTWDTTALVARKFEEIVKYHGLGGAMAWSLGEDSDKWDHIAAIAKGVASCQTCTANATSVVPPMSQIAAVGQRKAEPTVVLEPQQAAVESEVPVAVFAEDGEDSDEGFWGDDGWWYDYYKR